ncbi:uncharacterized protein MYCFIDRAFT_83093 [Pseudocercospora fijiensis CIRAD86]|uniref:Uncharacterized protein n=1 Tax=Pseudocercospora fijiensis (strain CIRAD86) TaxID=383855 RepID=M2Z5G9_PSEFD|nr:uncharacterized protein MYCFIDRAFT_83093 [Pseudocercospora fijiensis CIRAD86]EME85065.1 hypothetical protein MYCFIDRAFT_83093 [Pseudocercospora fijiensis CIRAD86]
MDVATSLSGRRRHQLTVALLSSRHLQTAIARARSSHAAELSMVLFQQPVYWDIINVILDRIVSLPKVEVKLEREGEDPLYGRLPIDHLGLTTFLLNAATRANCKCTELVLADEFHMSSYDQAEGRDAPPLHAVIDHIARDLREFSFGAILTTQLGPDGQDALRRFSFVKPLLAESKRLEHLCLIVPGAEGLSVTDQFTRLVPSLLEKAYLESLSIIEL